MASWVECKDYGTGQTIFVNLDVVVSVSSNGRATVIRYGGGGQQEQLVVEGEPMDLLANQAVR